MYLHMLARLQLLTAKIHLGWLIFLTVDLTGFGITWETCLLACLWVTEEERHALSVGDCSCMLSVITIKTL